jgi:hypothetical protein
MRHPHREHGVETVRRIVGEFVEHNWKGAGLHSRLVRLG